MTDYAQKKRDEDERLRQKWAATIEAERKASPPQDRDWLATDPDADPEEEQSEGQIELGNRGGFRVFRVKNLTHVE